MPVETGKLASRLCLPSFSHGSAIQSIDDLNVKDTCVDSLADTSATLAAAIIESIHSFSMQSMLALDNWIEAVQNDLEYDQVATKHYHHVRKLEETQKGE
jgi:hypothetical protein